MKMLFKDKKFHLNARSTRLLPFFNFQVKKVGFKHQIVASFSHMTRVGDTFLEELREKGEDLSNMYAFTELSDNIDRDGMELYLFY